MRISKSSLAVVTGGVLLLGFAGEAAAQVCVGFPSARGQAAAAVTANFPTGGNDFGIEGGYFLPAGIGVFGGVSMLRPDNADDVTSFGAGVSYSLTEMLPQLPTGLYGCPVVSISIATAGGDFDTVTAIPVGMGFATILALGETMALSPYAIPQLRWRTAGGDSDVDWQLSAGALLIGFLGPRVYAGATVNRIFIDGADSVLGLKFGLTF